MRLKAELWIKAYLRSVASAGAFATVVRHGDDDAGAIFIKVCRLDGTVDLYVPAPTGFADAAERQERLWTAGASGGSSESDVDARLARESRFDSDLWVIEVEDRQGRHFLGDWLVTVRP